MTLSENMTVGQLATEHPLAAKVLQRHGIPYCTGGRSLREACLARNVDPLKVLQEVAEEERNPEHAPVVDWRTRSPEELIHHLIWRYHGPLRDDLLRLEELAITVLRMHGEKEPERLLALVEAIQSLIEEMLPHMDREEQVLFPMILAGRVGSALSPITVMHGDHREAATLLTKIRALTHEYTLPADATEEWALLYEGLEAVDADLQEHLHLENHVLFPAALHH